MKIAIFGLTVSSSWGNGHATLWRGLCRALARLGHEVVFFERDVPYYAEHRDLHELPGGGALILYPSWDDVRDSARRHVHDADAAIVTSFCPDGVLASDLVLSSNVAVKAFYDLDTPVTLAALDLGQQLSYLGDRGLGEFDLVLSFTGGAALQALEQRLKARRVVVLYGHVDPDVHRPVAADSRFSSSLSYLGTYSDDRQLALEELFLEPARRIPGSRFCIGGSMYPDTIEWPRNVTRFRHVPPAQHAAFFCSSRVTLNVTRQTMSHMGYCPSGRLFEATACGAALASDWWEGIEIFFEPGREILVVRRSHDVTDIFELSQDELGRIAAAARERTLAEHTADRRAQQLERALSGIARSNLRRPQITPQEA